MSRWLGGLVQGCRGFAENEVVVSFEAGCPTTMRFARDVPAETATCLVANLGGARWACQDLACASVAESTLP